MKIIGLNISKSIKLALVFLIVCGLVYPLMITGISQLVFPYTANGSQIIVDGKVIGSQLIGQKFTEDCYLHGRLSAVGYNTFSKDNPSGNDKSKIGSGSDNLAMTNPKLKERLAASITDFLKKNPTVKKQEIPTDLLTQSGSGLDPNISVEGALVQVDRISKASGIDKKKIVSIINDNTQDKLLGILGEKRVNVLKVNTEIAKLMGKI